jgi:hypothetical protein
MRWLARATILAAFALSACPDDVQDGSGGAGGSAERWGEGDCWSCAEAACPSERDGCAADPACAVWLDCLLDCPPAAEGDVDPACASACAPPESGIGQEAQAALEGCRASADCPSCGAGGDDGSILHQSCPTAELPDACDDCEAESCCETPCDAACQAQIECQMGCNFEWECSKACYENDPVGQQSVARWLGCMAVQCRDVCPGIIQTDGCAECMLTKCDELYAQCFDASACYLRLMCGSSCDGTPECYAACDAAHPSPEFDSLLLCVFDQCVGDACSPDPEL